MFLKGGTIGLKYMLYPNFSKLNFAHLFTDAFTHSYNSLKLGGQGLIPLASVYPYEHNVWKEVFILVAGDTFISLLSSFGVFAAFGHIASRLNASI